MLHENDMAAIRALMIELLEANNHIFKLELRDEMYAMNKVLENRLNTRIDRLDVDMKKMCKEIVTDIAEILEVSVLPQITELQLEVVQIKEKVGMR